MEYFAGVFHIPISEFDTIERILLDGYDVGTYLIGHEHDPFSHFHFVAQLPNKKQWTAFQKKIVTKYDLRGKATAGKPRQYGSIKNIRDIDKLKAYTVKQNNVRTNMTDKDYCRYLEMSFTSANNRAFFDALIEELESIADLTVLKHTVTTFGNETTYHVENDIFPKIYKEILRYCITKDYKVSPSQVKSWGYSYIQKTKHLNLETKMSYLMLKLR